MTRVHLWTHFFGWVGRSPMRRAILLGIFALCVSAFSAAREGEAGDRAVRDDSIRRGRSLFEHVWTPKDPRSRAGDGLGPVFNSQSCVSCHDLGGTGGAGTSERNIEIATAIDPSDRFQGGYFYAFAMNFGSDGFGYSFSTNPSASSSRRARSSRAIDPNLLATIHPGFKQAPSLILHLFGTDPDYQSWRDKLPGFHGAIQVVVSKRNPSPLFGLGLIDAIPDSAIEAGAKRKTAVKGRVSRLKDGRIGRFGWKAQTATLDDFVVSAAAGEIGLEVPGRAQGGNPRLPGIAATGLDLNQEDCEDLVAFTRSLSRPQTHEPIDPKQANDAKAGESLFKSFGCAGCHAPKLGDVDGLYSDLLLHEMGDRLIDTGFYGVFVAGAPPIRLEPNGNAQRSREPLGASVTEWRTPPLWGLRDSAPYMHDGRAGDIDQAIRAHGGQGSASARRYAESSPRKRERLETFLMSLSAPPRERNVRGEE